MRLLVYKWSVIDNESLLSSIYIEKMESVFSNLPFRTYKNAKHIAVYDDEEIIGGVTLEYFSLLSDDVDITRNWNLEIDRPGIRILRFWGAKLTLPTLLFEAMWKTVPNDAMVFGILSVPYSLVYTDSPFRQVSLGNDRNWLKPKIGIEDSSWAKDSVPTSEGKRLLKAYLKMGAKPLGAPSVCSLDQSIKIVLGAFHHEVKLYRECYDQDNS